MGFFHGLSIVVCLSGRVWLFKSAAQGTSCPQPRILHEIFGGDFNTIYTPEDIDEFEREK